MDTRPGSRWKTTIFLVVAVLSNSFGNLLLAIGMDRMPAFGAMPITHYIYLLVANPYVIPGTALSAIYMLTQLSLFSWADLSFVAPVIASSYVVTALLGRFVMDEHVEPARWLGVTLICVGVCFVIRTPADTKQKGQ